MKILHIVQSAGGVDAYLMSLFKYIDSSKVENILLCSYDYDVTKYDNLVNQVIQVDIAREINIIKDFYSLIHIRKHIGVINPDIIYLHSSKAGVLGRVANWGLKKKCIYNPHGWSFNMDVNYIKKNIYKWIEKTLSNFTDQFVLISEAEKFSAIDMEITKNEKINVINNGIDLNQCIDCRYESISRNELGISNDAYVIGYVGRISKQKAPDTFVRFAEKVIEYIPNAHFMIVGDGDEKKWIIDMIQDRGLDHRFFISGWVDRPLCYMALFDQAMLLSRWEGFGLVLAEYMLKEKPIVATKVDAIPYLITDGVNGLLVEKDNIDQISDATIRLYNDEELRNNLSSNGYDIVQRDYSVERVAKEHIDLFIKTLQA